MKTQRDIGRTDQRRLYRARADAAWRARVQAQRAGDQDAAEDAIRDARYWERLALDAPRWRQA